MLYGQSEISTLRMRGQLRDGPDVRLAMSSLLSGADLHPPGAAPSSILMLRQLDDPLPGRLSLRTPGRILDRSWEQAVRSTLDDWRRRAARPFGGKVPAGAPAVFFRSEAELLACLALAVARDESPDWWWTLALRRWNLGPGCRLTPLLLQAARPLPGALRELWRWGKAVEAVSALAAPQVRALLARLAAEHGLDGLHIPANLSDEPPLLPSDRDTLEGRRATPWLGWISPDPAQSPLSRPQAALLGLGLSLAARPSALRSRKFFEGWQDWWTVPLSTVPLSTAREPSATSVDSLKAHLTPEPSVQRPPQEAAMDSRSQKGGQARTMQERRSDAPSSRELSNPLPVDGPVEFSAADAFPENVVGQASMPDPQPIQPGAPPSLAASPYRSADALGDAETEPARMRALPAEGSHSSHTDFDTPSEEGLDTRLAGVFYLVNFMQALELPGCFEEGWELSSRLGCWSLLESLGRAILDGSGHDLDGDPLWSVLADLDGRPPDEPPGSALLGSPSFLLPAQWLKSLGLAGASRWWWAAGRKLVRVWSEEGFLLAEGPLEGGAPSRLARRWIESAAGDARPVLKRKPLAGSPWHSLPGLEGRNWNPHLLRWLSLTLPFLRWRLKAAFQSDGVEAVQEMLLRPGRVFLSSSHLDVVMGLDDVSLPARLSGLDRNPGWVPEWGRVVLFHFK